ncbi:MULTISPECIES: DUF2239 family protein [unclassified Bradyrhizobium]|uniref:DUF2239 family protein n=1 Tax=unclassified Bradyrhizobium TaxID=2631580 RepID=UPI0028E656B1|nr:MULTISPECIES: DUF2239 family protein [unclassified Bradyrhizobium]
MDTFTAFAGQTRVAAGPLPKVALVLKHAAPGTEPIVIFSDRTGQPIDLDLRGSDREILARLPVEAGAAANQGPSEPRGRGRPKLGVVAREVTLLPQHWDWLNAQPGGASVALRKLVHDARRASGDTDRAREARDAAYHFMSGIGSNLPQFEEASRALFAGDLGRFAALIADWPADIRDHAVALAHRHRAE